MNNDRNKSSMNKYLVLSALGDDRPGIVNDLSRAILACDGNISDSRMSVLGGKFALILMVSGSQEVVEKLEAMLPDLEEKLGLTIIAKRTEYDQSSLQKVIPYYVEVVAMDHPGIIHEVAGFLSARGINIENMDTRGYNAAHTGTPMFSLEITIDVPEDLVISKLQDEFIEYCDKQNLDVTIKPLNEG
jgi:glycine cleavage system transcriptional repressor